MLLNKKELQKLIDSGERIQEVSIAAVLSTGTVVRPTVSVEQFLGMLTVDSTFNCTLAWGCLFVH